MDWRAHGGVRTPLIGSYEFFRFRAVHAQPLHREKTAARARQTHIDVPTEDSRPRPRVADEGFSQRGVP